MLVISKLVAEMPDTARTAAGEVALVRKLAGELNLGGLCCPLVEDM